MALHSTAHEFFTLLSSATLIFTADEEMEGKEDQIEGMAVALEKDVDVNQSWGRLGWAAAQVDFATQQSKLIVRFINSLAPLLFSSFN